MASPVNMPRRGPHWGWHDAKGGGKSPPPIVQTFAAALLASLIMYQEKIANQTSQAG